MLSDDKEIMRIQQNCVGKKIRDICLDDNDNVLRVDFADGYKVQLWDNTHECSEERYMSTDDKLQDFIGATWIEAEIRDGPTTDDNWNEVHDIQFLLISTSKGTFTLETHNKHNGYYEGFEVVMREVVNA